MQDDTKWLIAREIPHLRRYALALERDPDRADDLVQDCLERAVRKRGTWRRSGSLRSWMFRILYRTYLNGRTARRRRNGEVPLEEAADRFGQAPRQERRMEVLHVVEALDRLPEDQRAAILLVALEGAPYDEAAWVLDIPVGTLRSRLARGREALGRLEVAAPEPRLKRVK